MVCAESTRLRKKAPGYGRGGHYALLALKHTGHQGPDARDYRDCHSAILCFACSVNAAFRTARFLESSSFCYENLTVIVPSYNYYVPYAPSIETNPCHSHTQTKGFSLADIRFIRATRCFRPMEYPKQACRFVHRTPGVDFVCRAGLRKNSNQGLPMCCQAGRPI